MSSLNMLIEWLKVAILPLDLSCSGPVTHSGKILNPDKSHGKKPDGIIIIIIIVKILNYYFLSKSSQAMRGVSEQSEYGSFH
jgi:hypothetical protein